MYSVRLTLKAEEFYGTADRPLAKKLARCFEVLEQTPRNHPILSPSKGRLLDVSDTVLGIIV